HVQPTVAPVMPCEPARYPPPQSGGRFALLLDSRLLPTTPRLHFRGNCGKSDSVRENGPTESPLPARCTRGFSHLHSTVDPSNRPRWIAWNCSIPRLKVIGPGG